MVYLVDSSVWVAVYRDTDPNHKKALKLIMDIGNDKILLPYCVLNEVSTVLTYKHSKEQAVKFLNTILNGTNIKLIDNHTDDEIAFFKGLPQRISFTDSSLLLLAKMHKAKLATLDKQLARLAKK